MNITIIGGGSIGTLMSAEFSLEGAHNITLYASEPECRENIISVYNSCENLLFKGRVNLITYDLKLAVSRSDVIFITYPASMLRELAEKMFFKPSSVSVTIQKMEDSGYILREPHESDARQFRIFLTESGKALADKIRRTFEQVEKETFETLTPEEITELRRILEKLRSSKQ